MFGTKNWPQSQVDFSINVFLSQIDCAILSEVICRPHYQNL